LSEDRFRDGNDLDNLAKLVLDALSLQIKSKGTIWKGYGVIKDDSDIVDLILIKRLAKHEYIKILVYSHEQDEAFRDAILKELCGAISLPKRGVWKKYVVFEDLSKASAPKIHTTECSYYKK
jgi:hypothetical protein